MSSWPPLTEAAIDKAITDGLLIEGQHLDLKRELESGNRANRGLAIDIASLAVDGGVIIIGVDEAGTSGPIAAPCDLAGRKERVQNVALTRIQDGITVQATEVPSTRTPGHGYLVIIVPMSPVAPHMVDGKYRGRAGATNRELTHSEVVRLFERRQSLFRDLTGFVHHQIDRDLILQQLRGHGHLYVVAAPSLPPSRDLVSTFRNDDAAESLRAWTGLPGGEFSRRAEGFALYSPPITASRSIEGSSWHRVEHQLFDLEVSEAGSLSLWFGGATATHEGEEAREERVQDTKIVQLVYIVARTAARVARALSYGGPWDIGVAANGLKGKRSLGVLHAFATPYSEDLYLEAARVTSPELEDLDAVVRRLAGRLVRGLGRDDMAPFQKPYE